VIDSGEELDPSALALLVPDSFTLSLQAMSPKSRLRTESLAKAVPNTPLNSPEATHGQVIPTFFSGFYGPLLISTDLY